MAKGKRRRVFPRRQVTDALVSADMERLWSLSAALPIILLRVNDLRWNLAETRWTTDAVSGNGKAISPDDVLSGKEVSVSHSLAIRDADFTYPILLLLQEDGKFDVVDGLHRLCAAVIQGMPHVLARVVPDAMFIASAD